MRQIHFNTNKQMKVHLNAGGPLLLVINLQFPLRHPSL